MCQQCVAHGSECIDQRQVFGEIRRDETLRERVARLESLLHDVLKDTKDKERPNDQDITELVNLSEEVSEEAPIAGVEDRAPMVLLLVESEVSYESRFPPSQYSRFTLNLRLLGGEVELVAQAYFL